MNNYKGMLSRSPIKPTDRKISASQLNQNQRFNNQQRLGQRIVTDEVQFTSVGDPNAGYIEMRSIPVLYKTVDYGVSSSSISDEDPNVYAKRVATPSGDLTGGVVKFVKLESA